MRIRCGLLILFPVISMSPSLIDGIKRLNQNFIEQLVAHGVIQKMG